jgi:signal transduction histidine kinase
VKRIKITLGLSLLLLTTVSMLVTNFVILPFWAGDILVREARHLQRLLAAPPRSAAARNGQIPLSPSLQSLLDDFPGGCVVFDDSFHCGRQSVAACGHGLKPVVAGAVETGRVHTSLPSFSLTGLFSSRYLYVAVPIASPDASFRIAAAGVPVSPLMQSLWSKEQIIAAYLVFNAFILAALAFFRLLKSYVQPVDRMVQAAENYRSDGLHVFLVERPANELGQLAGSIQAMVQRIEADKEKLAGAVKELAEKNTLLRDNQREMIRAEKLATVGRLTAGLAHEIGNPLGVALGYLQLLGMDDCSGEERVEYAAKAYRELERVDGLIRRLLDYTRTGKGTPGWFDLHDLLGEIVEDLKVQPFLKGIRLDLDLQAAMSVIWVDREQLRQVFLNCVLNAADAIKVCPGRKGEGIICVATTLFSIQGRYLLLVTIADNGIGIPEELLDMVFDPFFTTKGPGAGTGLGLSVSLGLVEAMNGRMNIRSTAGEGTTVEVLLPLADRDELKSAISPYDTEQMHDH